MFNSNNGNNGPKRSFGNYVSTAAKHPISFAAHTLGGEVAGMGVGAIGGALVTAPLAAASIAASRGRNMKAFWPEMAKRMSVGVQSEVVGGGIAGGLMGGGKFYKKYPGNQQTKQASYTKGFIDEFKKTADIRINDEQSFSPSGLGTAIGSTAGLHFGINQMWSNIGKAPNGAKMQEIITSNIEKLPIKEKLIFLAKLSKNFIGPALIGTAAGAIGGNLLAKSLEKASIKTNKKEFSFGKKASVETFDSPVAQMNAALMPTPVPAITVAPSEPKYKNNFISAIIDSFKKAKDVGDKIGTKASKIGS